MWEDKYEDDLADTLKKTWDLTTETTNDIKEKLWAATEFGIAVGNQQYQEWTDVIATQLRDTRHVGNFDFSTFSDADITQVYNLLKAMTIVMKDNLEYPAE